MTAALRTWPEGEPVVDNPHEMAAVINAKRRDWSVWYGVETGHFWAIHLRLTAGIEASSIGSLLAQLDYWDMWHPELRP